MDINIFGYGDIERWIIIIFITMSLGLLWSTKWYDRPLKVLLTIPRIYLLVYYLILIWDVYHLRPDFEYLALSGIGSVYGILLLFGVETYARWAVKKYRLNGGTPEMRLIMPEREEKPVDDNSTE